MKLAHIYLAKFVIYGGISAYDYSIQGKWTFAWLILALMMIMFFIDATIKESRERNFTKQDCLDFLKYYNKTARLSFDSTGENHGLPDSEVFENFIKEE